jgi:hypothetical protein
MLSKAGDMTRLRELHRKSTNTIADKDTEAHGAMKRIQSQLNVHTQVAPFFSLDTYRSVFLFPTIGVFLVLA